MAKQTEWMRAASSGREDIRSVKWEGDCAPKAVVQIAHGMAEHPERYNDFASFLADNGYAVYMNEHAGHGRHAETLGYFAERDGMDFLVADMKSLSELMREEHPGLPIFLLGHSMGSFLALKYCVRYGAELDGCILSGTAGSNPLLSLGRLIAILQKTVKGSKSQGRFLSLLAFGSYTKKIENPVNSCAWLSSVDEVCIAYSRDEYCGFPFTAAGYSDLFNMMAELSKKTWAVAVPASLPLLIFSGDADPVGNYGKGVTEVYECLEASGQRDLTLTLYPGGRHEMLNESNRAEVYADILAWLDKRMPA